MALCPISAENLRGTGSYTAQDLDLPSAPGVWRVLGGLGQAAEPFQPVRDSALPRNSRRGGGAGPDEFPLTYRFNDIYQTGVVVTATARQGDPFFS